VADGRGDGVGQGKAIQQCGQRLVAGNLCGHRIRANLGAWAIAEAEREKADVDQEEHPADHPEHQLEEKLPDPTVSATVGIEDVAQGSLGAGRLSEPPKGVQRRLHHQPAAGITVHQVTKLVSHQRDSHPRRQDEPERDSDRE
jgi:hypothetical protein